jgi:FAD/FMN-containing dehydrogenase
VPAKPKVRNYYIEYQDVAAFFRDLRTLLARGELNDVYNICFPFGTNLAYQLNAAIFFDPAAPPDNLRLMRGLSVPAAAIRFVDFDYLTYVERVDLIYNTYMTTMDWNNKVKAWYDVWLPDSTVEQYVGEVVPTLTPTDVGPTGFVLLFPQRRAKLTRPFFRVPAVESTSDWVYLFDILTDNLVSGPDPVFAERMQQRNRLLFERARALGGIRYPIGVLPFSHEDWVAHYGEMWTELVKRKRRYDPDNILTPGPGIF